MPGLYCSDVSPGALSGNAAADRWRAGCGRVEGERGALAGMSRDGQFDIRVAPGVLPGIVCGRAPGGRPSQQDDLICLHDARESTISDGAGRRHGG